MLGLVFAVVYSFIVRKLHGRIHFSKAQLAKIAAFRHHGTIVAEGLEFHFFMTFVFPLTHGGALAASHLTHIEWILALYH